MSLLTAFAVFGKRESGGAVWHGCTPNALLAVLRLFPLTNANAVKTVLYQ